MEVIIQLKEELERTRSKLMAMEQKEKDNEIIRLSYQYEADEMGLEKVALPKSHHSRSPPSPAARSRSDSTTSSLERSLDRATPRKEHRRRSRRGTWYCHYRKFIPFFSELMTTDDCVLEPVIASDGWRRCLSFSVVPDAT